MPTEKEVGWREMRFDRKGSNLDQAKRICIAAR
jgi:hypothetical protein